MKITREKRPDRVIFKGKEFACEFILDEEGDLLITADHWDNLYVAKSEIPNLIKALEEVSK